MIVIGFTGTRGALTRSQVNALEEVFKSSEDIYQPYGGVTLHHGDCIGADSTAHSRARDHGFYIVTHPPLNPAYRGWNIGDEEQVEKPYLIRNEDIVTASHSMLAMPKDDSGRGGTWATIKLAKAIEKPLLIVYPGGSQERLHGVKL